MPGGRRAEREASPLSDWIGPLAGIVLVDLVLAGDNAVVIGMAARRLPDRQRKQAILWGSVAAVALRLLFAAVVTLLLGVPLLRAVGGLLLFWIAWKLSVDLGGHEEEVGSGRSLWEAVQIIIVADAVMSLDNVLALAGVAHGDLGLLAIGLGLTVPLIVWGSSLISLLMNRAPWLLFVGVAVLIWTGAGLVLEDPVLHPLLPGWLVADERAVKLVLTAAGTAAIWTHARRRGERPPGGSEPR